MFKQVVCSLAVVLGATASARAADVTVQPAAMLDQLMKSSAGTWACEGTYTGADGTAEKMKSTAKIIRELNGNLYVGEFNTPKSAKMPATKSHAEWYYDGVSKTVVHTMVCDSGDSGRSTSPGRTGDTSVWMGEGTMMGQPMKTRMTITYKGEKEITLSHEVDKGGTWVKFGDEVCKK